jgi:hypothetical protein
MYSLLVQCFKVRVKCPLAGTYTTSTFSGFDKEDVRTMAFFLLRSIKLTELVSLDP